MSIWNVWATSFRNARAMGVAVVMLIAISVMLSLRCNPLVRRDSVLGLVLEIEAEGLRPLGEGELQSRVLIATPDSNEIRLFMPPPVPRPGDFIRLDAEYYRNGDTMYILDELTWRTDGPQ